MEFVNYEAGRSGTTIAKPNNIIMLENILTRNIKNFREFHDSTFIKVDSSHTLSKLCNTASNRQGSTPEATYDNVQDAMRYIANLHGIVYPGVDQSTSNVLFGEDMLIHNTFSVKFDSMGNIRKSDSAFKVNTHWRLGLRLSDYITGGSSETSSAALISVDLPLLAALLHQAEKDAHEACTSFVLDSFITKEFYMAIASDIINIAMMNRLHMDAVVPGASADLNDGTNILPYQYSSPERLYRNAIDDYEGYFKQLAGKSLADVYANFPTPEGIDGHDADISDYYSDKLMWVNAVSEVKAYSVIRDINEMYDLGLELSTHENMLDKLLRGGRGTRMSNHLENGSDMYDRVSSLLTRK